MDSSSDDDSALDTTLFQEPKDYFPLAKPFTYTSYTLLNGQTLHLRLVGHNPLWAHHIWNGALTLSHYLQTHPTLTHTKAVLELGAGAGLPSLVAAGLGAKTVLATDYPDEDLIANLQHNIITCAPLLSQGDDESRFIATGYLWGAPTHALTAHLLPPSKKFDTLLLADLLFNHSCHASLIHTLTHTLSQTPFARALVFFTPYRPWLLERDMAFFDLCREEGLVVEKVVEERMEKVMFEGDRGDEGLRRTVFGFEVRWRERVVGHGGLGEEETGREGSVDG